jgi:hypothetical protein
VEPARPRRFRSNYTKLHQKGLVVVAGAETEQKTERSPVSTTVSDRVLGAIGSAMILAAAWILLFGGPGDTGVASATAPPQLELISPASGDTSGAPVTLHFASSLPLGMQPGGWGAAGFHLHAEIDGQEIMPRPDDIRREGDGVYLWELASLPAGEHSVRIVWSDASHAPVVGGATEPVSVTVR